MRIRDILTEVTRRQFLGGALGTAFMYGVMHTRPGSAAPQLSPYDREVQQYTFDVVAGMMRIKVDPSKPKPRVVDFNNVDKRVFLETFGFIPEKPVHHYQWKRNIIILSSNARVDSLAHEYVHYFQFMYRDAGELLNTPAEDELEAEAVMYQNKFRNLISRPM